MEVVWFRPLFDDTDDADHRESESKSPSHSPVDQQPVVQDDRYRVPDASDLCISSTRKHPDDTRQAFELIFELL
jgi:hypothetical protein